MSHTFWQNGFRPFFPAAALWAAIIVPVWIVVLSGGIEAGPALTPVAWHLHELLFAFVPAVIAGFLLTAIPNWTGRKPVAGLQLMGLFVLWLAGRVAMVSGFLGTDEMLPWYASLLALSFLPVLVGRMGHELIQSGNSRNLKVLIGILVLWLGQILFLAEASGSVDWLDGHGYRLAFAGILFLIMLIGGRIIPAFTRNWLRQQGRPTDLPDFNRLDMLAAFGGLITLLVWTFWPDNMLTGWLALIAAALHLVRLARWKGWLCASEILITMLHLAYLFIPVGYLLLALYILGDGLVDQNGAIHAWSVGAIAGMILVVMSRACLGHSGRPLTAGWGLKIVFLSILAAAITRIFASFDIWYTGMLHLSSTVWMVAFGLFFILFLPVVLKKRVD